MYLCVIWLIKFHLKSISESKNREHLLYLKSHHKKVKPNEKLEKYL